MNDDFDAQAAMRRSPLGQFAHHADTYPEIYPSRELARAAIQPFIPRVSLTPSAAPLGGHLLDDSGHSSG